MTEVWEMYVTNDRWNNRQYIVLKHFHASGTKYPIQRAERHRHCIR